MTTNNAGQRARDAERTRDCILQAATSLFAEQGFNATTIAQIAEAAGVARGTPSYFFGTKEGLWKAVLEQQNRVAASLAPAALARLGPHASRDALVHALVDVFLDFHSAHPEFLRLIQWSELQRNTLIHQVEAHRDAIQSALMATRHLLAATPLARESATHVVLTVFGACNAHLMFGQTLAPALGLDVGDPEFQLERRAHLKRLLSAALDSTR